jgi:2'-5' RNA ligase
METPSQFWALMADRFRTLDRVVPELARWRTEWGPHRRGLVLLVELATLDAIADFAGRVGDALRAVGVQPVDRDGLHITICEFGFVDELVFDVGSVTAEIRVALAGADAAATSVVGAGSFPTAAIMRLDPWDDLAGIHQRVHAAVDALAGVRERTYRPAPEGGYAPHATVAYYEKAVLSAEVTRALEPFERVEPIPIRVDAVALVEVGPPTDSFFTWDVVERFPLAP